MKTSNELRITAVSSHGTITFNDAGHIIQDALGEDFGHKITDIDMESLTMADITWSSHDFNRGTVDILYVGYFHKDMYGRRQYSPKLDDPRCPSCKAVFNVGCSCFPDILLSRRGTLYMDRKELTYEKSQRLLNFKYSPLQRRC